MNTFGILLSCCSLYFWSPLVFSSGDPHFSFPLPNALFFAALGAGTAGRLPFQVCRGEGATLRKFLLGLTFPRALLFKPFSLVLCSFGARSFCSFSGFLLGPEFLFPVVRRPLPGRLQNRSPALLATASDGSCAVQGVARSSC